MLQDFSATMTVSTTLFLHLRKTSKMLSEIARFGNEFCKLFQVLLVFDVKAILDSTIDIDNGNNLYGKIAVSVRDLGDISRLLFLSQFRKLSKVECNEKR
jgi:hypothetical protein